LRSRHAQSFCNQLIEYTRVNAHIKDTA